MSPALLTGGVEHQACEHRPGRQLDLGGDVLQRGAHQVVHVPQPPLVHEQGIPTGTAAVADEHAVGRPGGRHVERGEDLVAAAAEVRGHRLGDGRDAGAVRSAVPHERRSP